MKSITPVISVILLILITIVASASAYFFISSNVLDLQNKGSADTFPGMDNSRLNLVSMTGSRAIVRNDGTSPVTEVVIFINDELFNYTLDEPIMPGELKEINYTSQLIARDLEIKMIYNSGKTAQAVSPARVNTEASGFVESHCPDSICDISGGETLINCFRDCGFGLFMYQHENYNGADDAIVALQMIYHENESACGNRSVVYVPGDELTDSKHAFLNNNYYFTILNHEGNIHYLYYDGSQMSSPSILTHEENVHETRAIGVNNNAHLMFENCTQSYNQNCDLVYFNWSISSGFSGFEKATSLNQSDSLFTNTEQSPTFSVSNNEKYMLTAWNYFGLVNYTVFNNSWSETLTLFNDSDISEIIAAIINNRGEILIIYSNGSQKEAMQYNGSDWEKIDNSLFSSSSSVSAESLDDSFLIIYNSGSYFNSTVLSGNEFTNIQQIFSESSVVVMPFKIKYNYIMGFIMKTSGFGLSYIYDSLDNLWKNRIDVAISGLGIPYCQEYERFSGECATETWCSDGVDNDEDGYYDSDDSDC